MGEKEAKKTHQQVAFSIPIKLWDKIEMKRLKDKQKMPDRKFTVTEQLVGLIEKGLNG